MSGGTGGEAAKAAAKALYDARLSARRFLPFIAMSYTATVSWKLYKVHKHNQEQTRRARDSADPNCQVCRYGLLVYTQAMQEANEPPVCISPVKQQELPIKPLGHDGTFERKKAVGWDKVDTIEKVEKQRQTLLRERVRLEKLPKLAQQRTIAEHNLKLREDILRRNVYFMLCVGDTYFWPTPRTNGTTAVPGILPISNGYTLCLGYWSRLEFLTWRRPVQLTTNSGQTQRDTTTKIMLHRVDNRLLNLVSKLSCGVYRRAEQDYNWTVDAAVSQQQVLTEAWHERRLFSVLWAQAKRQFEAARAHEQVVRGQLLEFVQRTVLSWERHTELWETAIRVTQAMVERTIERCKKVIALFGGSWDDFVAAIRRRLDDR